MLLLAVPVLPWVARYALEAVLGIACLVATLGVAVTEETYARVGYGSYAGFVAAALLLLATLAPLERPSVNRRRALACAVPLLASLACVAAVLVPAWQGVLPALWTNEAAAVRSWFAVATLLLALHLLRVWVGQSGSAAGAGQRLTLVPLLILPLPVLELFIDTTVVVWGGVILIGLCLLLAILGRIEQRSGMERLRLPEILRVDRLPETES
jgi:hypothetical protein